MASQYYIEIFVLFVIIFSVPICAGADTCDLNPCLNGGTCNANGNSTNCSCAPGYTGIKCETKPSCEKPNTPPNANYDLTIVGLSPGESVKYVCKEGYKKTSGDAERTCKTDYTWTGTAPTCEKQSCKEPSTLPNANSILKTIGGLDHGDSVKYKCKLGYRKKSGDEERTCKTDNTWSGTALTCEVIPLCDNNPCKNGGNCSLNPTEKTYNCTCTDLFSGRNCEIDTVKKNQLTIAVQCAIDKTNPYLKVNTTKLVMDLIEEKVEIAKLAYVDQKKLKKYLSDDDSDVDHKMFLDLLTKTQMKDLQICASTPCTNDGTCTQEACGFKCSCKGNYEGPTCENEKMTTVAHTETKKVTTVADTGNAVTASPEGKNKKKSGNGDLKSYATYIYIGIGVAAAGVIVLAFRFRHKIQSYLCSDDDGKGQYKKLKKPKKSKKKFMDVDVEAKVSDFVHNY